MSEYDGEAVARVGYGIAALLIIWALINHDQRSDLTRVCEGRDGLKVAKSVPAGKSRFRHDVITLEGEHIPYAEWVHCQAVYLPGQAPGE